MCGACRTPTPCQTTAFTCVFRCFPCDPSCGSASWAAPEFAPRSAAPMVKMTRSKTFQAYLPSCHRTYSCIHCRAHLANHDELISKVLVSQKAFLASQSGGISCSWGHRLLSSLFHTVWNICMLSFIIRGGLTHRLSFQWRINSESQGQSSGSVYFRS